MKKLISSLIVLLAITSISRLDAQEQKRAASTGGNSPHETTSAVIDNNRVTIIYGRPFTKHPKTGEVRKIWGGLVPYGKAWRMGSDEATTLITQQPIVLGGTEIPAGAYTLGLPNWPLARSVAPGACRWTKRTILPELTSLSRL